MNLYWKYWIIISLFSFWTCDLQNIYGQNFCGLNCKYRIVIAVDVWLKQPSFYSIFSVTCIHSGTVACYVCCSRSYGCNYLSLLGWQLIPVKDIHCWSRRTSHSMSIANSSSWRHGDPYIQQINLFRQASCYNLNQYQAPDSSSWGQHGAHLGPTGPRWAPCWPHELCYLGRHATRNMNHHQQTSHLDNTVQCFLTNPPKKSFVKP